MSKPSRGLVLAVVIVVVLAVLVIARLLMRGTGGEERESTVDMAVHVGRITRATFHRLVTAYGTIQPEPAGSGRQPGAADVAAPATGIIARVDCREGQRVAKGTILFHLDGRVAVIARERARKALAFAQENFNRQKQLLTVDGTSKKNYLDAEQQLQAAQSEFQAASTDLALLEITAPLDGTVVAINSGPGEAVEANTVLARVIDLERLQAAVDVPVHEAALLKVGQDVRCEGNGKAGAVAYIGSQVDGQTDTLPVRIAFPRPNAFYPGQFVEVAIVCAVHADSLAVPEAAVVADAIGGASGTIVMVKDGRAFPKAVRIGLREAGLVEITAPGLLEGQVIVSEDAYAVPGDVKIHIVE
jgi:membrane fusion protein (multidrug efflux system)